MAGWCEGGFGGGVLTAAERGTAGKKLHLHLVLCCAQTPVGTPTASGKEEGPPRPDSLERVTVQSYFQFSARVSLCILTLSFDAHIRGSENPHRVLKRTWSLCWETVPVPAAQPKLGGLT